MNDSVQHLCRIAAKEKKWIIGLMSGTSLDGLDIALCQISGTGRHTEVELHKFKTAGYDDALRAELREIVSVENVSLQNVCLLHSRLGDYHGDLIIEALQEWDIAARDVDLIASHGQSIYHAPATRHRQQDMPNATFQIIDGDHIACKTGIITISDFRQKHTAAGGEGAPMVALTDQMLYADEQISRVLLNIGGISNFTYLPAKNSGRVSLTTDVGPGNTLIDHAMHTLFNQPYDKNGAVARRGKVNAELLQILLDDPFFSLPVPRTTGPELFNMAWLNQKMGQADIVSVADEDMIATLTRLSAQTIAEAIRKTCGDEQLEIYLSGGGMHNPSLVKQIEQNLHQPTHSFAEIGFNPDAKEAVCFAVLANEMLSGEAFIINPKQQGPERVNFGKISLPV